MFELQMGYGHVRCYSHVSCSFNDVGWVSVDCSCHVVQSRMSPGNVWTVASSSIPLSCYCTVVGQTCGANVIATPIAGRASGAGQNLQALQEAVTCSIPVVKSSHCVVMTTR